MTFNDYQDSTKITAIFRGSIDQLVSDGDTRTYKLLCLSYVALGLGEVGEIQGKIKKLIRDSKGMITDENKKAIGKELGDLLWYVSETATELGLKLEDIVEGNLEKLSSRKDRGVLEGSGDDR